MPPIRTRRIPSRSSSSLVTTAAIIALTGAATADTITSVQEGVWTDAAT